MVASHRPASLGGERQVSGRAFSLVLQAMKETLDADSYADLLTAAGLARIVHAPPEAEVASISEQELSGLYGTLYRRLGDALTRLFFSNHGARMAQSLLASPSGQELIAEVARAPADRKLAVAVRALQAVTNRFWSEVEVGEEAQAYRLSYAHCPVCADIPRSPEAMCASVSAVWSGVLRGATGHRVFVHETACAAQGAPRCEFRILK